MNHLFNIIVLSKDQALSESCCKELSRNVIMFYFMLRLLKQYIYMKIYLNTWPIDVTYFSRLGKKISKGNMLGQTLIRSKRDKFWYLPLFEKMCKINFPSDLNEFIPNMPVIDIQWLEFNCNTYLTSQF